MSNGRRAKRKTGREAASNDGGAEVTGATTAPAASPPPSHPAGQPWFQLTPLAACIEIRHRRNPKEHNIDNLIASFLRFGFVAFPTIDESSGVMVTGHGRCEALKVMKDRGDEAPRGVVVDGGDWIIPVVRGVSFRSERERDAYVIADNQHTIAGGWKFDLLTEVLKDLDAGMEDEFGVEDGLGFDKIELDSLLGNYDPGDPPGNGVDPEAGGAGGDAGGGAGDGAGGAAGGGEDRGRARTTITAVIECPACGHRFER